MNIAFLFDAFAYDNEHNYWWAIRKAIFSSDILQLSDRHMCLSIGDITCGISRGTDVEKLYHSAYNSSQWSNLAEDKLIEAFFKSVVFGVVFENIPRSIVTDIDSSLASVRYRNTLSKKYRLRGRKCRAFYSMDEEDEKDPHDLEEMESLGFIDTGWEDRGARGTIFDDFDTLEHFQRVATFRQVITPYLHGGEDDAYEMVLLLEDLNPKLFDALGAATERISTADTEEEVAQAALSGRRYMEQLADALFPARSGKHNGRTVNQAAYKNRLWAFVEENTVGDAENLNILGGEIDRAVEELNSALHGRRSADRVYQAFADIAQISVKLLTLNPEKSKKPYFAYQNRMLDFLKEVLGQDAGNSGKNTSKPGSST
jgi:hypothetical protein